MHEQLSTQLKGVQLTVPSQVPVPTSIEISAGQFIKLGGRSSITVTVKEQVSAFPKESVAIQETMLTPSWKTPPLGIPSCCNVVPGQLSLTSTVG